MKTIFIVDDNELILELIEAFLEPHYQVVTFNNGLQAIEAALASPPDLLLVDHRMPGMDGIEVCQQLKNHPQSTTVPVIMLSASATEHEILKARQAGIDDYLSKPFNENSLLILQRYLG